MANFQHPVNGYVAEFRKHHGAGVRGDRGVAVPASLGSGDELLDREEVVDNETFIASELLFSHSLAQCAKGSLRSDCTTLGFTPPPDNAD